MGYSGKRSWGKCKVYYCPVNRKVWQLDKDNRLYIHHGLPSYGLERKELIK